MSPKSWFLLCFNQDLSEEFFVVLLLNAIKNYFQVNTPELVQVKIYLNYNSGVVQVILHLKFTWTSEFLNPVQVNLPEIFLVWVWVLLLMFERKVFSEGKCLFLTRSETVKTLELLGLLIFQLKETPCENEAKTLPLKRATISPLVVFWSTGMTSMTHVFRLAKIHELLKKNLKKYFEIFIIIHVQKWMKSGTTCGEIIAY